MKEEDCYIQKISLEGEIWKDVVGYEGLYKCSSFGRVFSCSKKFTFPNGGIRECGLKIHKPYKDRDGYYRMSLYKNGYSKNYGVHRIVAQCFIDNPNNYPCIDHINGVRDDNRVENLRWCTNKQNANFPLAIKNRGLAQRESYKRGRKMCDALRKRNEETKIALYAYTLDGVFVKKFCTASTACDFSGGFIFHGLRKDIFKHKDYVFSKYPITDFSIFPYKSPTASKTIEKVDIDKNVVVEYKSIHQAAKIEKITPYIVKRLISLGENYKGYIFRYKKD